MSYGTGSHRGPLVALPNQTFVECLFACAIEQPERLRQDPIELVAVDQGVIHAETPGGYAEEPICEAGFELLPGDPRGEPGFSHAR